VNGPDEPFIIPDDKTEVVLWVGSTCGTIGWISEPGDLPDLLHAVACEMTEIVDERKVEAR
jgi:hypothetical protein